VRYIGFLPDCPYCAASADDAWIANEHAVAVPPAKPVSSCHVVVAPRRHVPSFYDLDVQEQRVIWDMLRDLRQRISESLTVQGFDAGFVDVPAGREPAHTHVHLIPRVAGESIDRPAGAEWVDLS
jgi:diadenosine tetraphosphate (Ap4A) HIT family hydrolase